MKRHNSLTHVLFALLALFCFVKGSLAEGRSVLLVTTTSIQDAGLLDALIPAFEKKTGFFVKTIAVGSGQAMSLGRRGEADVLLVHSPQEEEDFMKAGFGINRRPVMFNDFVVVGPPSDPAGLKGMRSAMEAFRKIAKKNALFISRGDNSGTHAKEKSLWSRAGIVVPGPKWYHETGLGMGQTLTVASEKRAYTLTDKSTFLVLKKNINLVIFVEEDKGLRNVYHVIEVNPAKWRRLNARGARAFSDFLISKDAQQIIETFGVETFGTPLFRPARHGK